MKVPALVVLAGLLLTGGCGGQGGGLNQAQTGAALRLVVASRALAPADATLNGVVTDAGLDLGDASPAADRNPRVTPPGIYLVGLSRGGSPLVTGSVSVPENTLVTVFGLGDPAATEMLAPRFVTVSDPRTALDVARCNLHVVNATGGAVDVYATLPNVTTPLSSLSPVDSAIAPGAAGGLVFLEAGFIRFRITEAGTKNVILDTTYQTQQRTYGTLLVRPDATGAGLTLTPYGISL